MWWIVGLGCRGGGPREYDGLFEHHATVVESMLSDVDGKGIGGGMCSRGLRGISGGGPPVLVRRHRDDYCQGRNQGAPWGHGSPMVEIFANYPMLIYDFDPPKYYKLPV